MAKLIKTNFPENVRCYVDDTKSKILDILSFTLKENDRYLDNIKSLEKENDNLEKKNDNLVKDNANITSALKSLEQRYNALQGDMEVMINDANASHKHIVWLSIILVVLLFVCAYLSYLL